MKCQFCGKTVSESARYCTHCGKKMDVSFEDISRSLADQELAEKLQEKVRESRRVLAIALFLFLVSLIVYVAIPTPRQPDAVPVYRVEVPDYQEVNARQAVSPQFVVPK